MKKLVALVLAGIMSAMIASPAMAKDVKVVYEGEEMVFDVAPFIENDRTLVPMRAIFQQAGANVTWDGDTKTVISVFNNGDEQKFIILQIDNETAFINGNPVKLDVPAKIVDDRTFVPLRFVIENLGKTVTWDQDTYTVNID